jgi:hypothetical protein
MPQATRGLGQRWIRTLLAGIFLLTSVSASIAQCVDAPDRRRKEADTLLHRRGYPNPDSCEQVSPAPGMVYQPCRRCDDTLPLGQIKEDRAYLEFFSQSVPGTACLIRGYQQSLLVSWDKSKAWPV